MCFNYDIDYIVATQNQASFSRFSSFREIMVVATKRNPKGERQRHDGDRCLIVQLVEEPDTWQDARDIAEQIHLLKRSDTNTYSNSHFLATRVSQDLLRSTTDDLFSLVSTTHHLSQELWRELDSSEPRRLTSFANYLNANRGEIWRGLETRADVCSQVQEVFLLRNEARSHGLRDKWIVDRDKRHFLICRNRRTGIKVAIPRRFLKPGLRRLAGVRQIDISGNTDWVLYGNFARRIIRERRLNHQRQWRHYVRDRMGTLAVARRFGITRSGTTFLAFCCKYPFAPSGVMWTIKNIRPRYAKILALWFNSSPNLLQVLLNRVETSGPWMQLHEYVLDDLVVLDSGTLAEDKIKMLLATFDEIKDVQFPSLSEQLFTNFHARLAIDHAILRCFGFDNKTAERKGRHIRRALRLEFESLSRIDKGCRTVEH
jgi:hypothetical protein